jgi:hypothetical protein
MRPSTKSQLPARQAQLVDLMQKINFGTIEGLIVRDGLPVLKPRPRIVRDMKFGASNGSRNEAGLTDFALKSNVQELMATLSSLGNATILILEVRDGLPNLMRVEDTNV